MEKNAALRNSTIAALAIVLMLSVTCTPVYASNPRTSSANSYWFICYAGYAVTDIPFSYDGLSGSLGIDAYHVIASSFGPNYDLVMYYLATLNPVTNEPMYVPLAFYISKDIGVLTKLGFIYNPDISVSRDRRLTIIAENLPISYAPSTLTFRANPWQNRPETFQEHIVAEHIDVEFTGIWGGPSTIIEPTLVAQEFYVFLVKFVLKLSLP